MALHADGLLPPLDETPGGPAPRVQLGAGIPAHERGGREPLRVRPGTWAPLPLAEALGGAALLRPRGATGAHSRGRASRRAVRSLGARRAGMGGVRTAALLA